MKGKLVETDNVKMFRSKEFNFNFDKRNGYTATWGKTFEDNPDFSPFGPMILDIEVTDICKGIGNEGPCPFCSPGDTLVNTPDGRVDIRSLKKDDYVIGYDVDKGHPQIQQIEEVYSRDYIGDLICIETDDGKTLKLTPEHRIILKNGDEKMAKDLCHNDELIYF